MCADSTVHPKQNERETERERERKTDGERMRVGLQTGCAQTAQCSQCIFKNTKCKPMHFDWDRFSDYFHTGLNETREKEREREIG